MICACGHDEQLHGYGRKSKSGPIERLSCTAQDASFHFCRCEQFREARSIAKQLNADELSENGVGVVMAKKGKKVVLFEVTSKKADELLAKDNQMNAAIFYRVLTAKAEPMTRQAIYEASKSKCESAAAWERLGNQTHDTLARLRKAGFVKRTETREEALAAKPRTPRKRSSAAKAAKPPQSGAERQEGAAA